MAAPGNVYRCPNLTQSSLALRHDMAIFGLAPAEDPRVRSLLLCLAILLPLPCAAHAEQTGAIVRPEIKPAVDAEAFADAVPVLDLSFDPAVAALQDLAPLVPQAAAAPAARDLEASFSVGVDIKSRRELGSPAARATAERPGPPTLADKVEGIVERSAIGLTGTYRF
jgi:hypothetical protein